MKESKTFSNEGKGLVVYFAGRNFNESVVVKSREDVFKFMLEQYMVRLRVINRESKFEFENYDPFRECAGIVIFNSRSFGKFKTLKGRELTHFNSLCREEIGIGPATKFYYLDNEFNSRESVEHLRSLDFFVWHYRNFKSRTLRNEFVELVFTGLQEQYPEYDLSKIIER